MAAKLSASSSSGATRHLRIFSQHHPLNVFESNAHQSFLYHTVSLGHDHRLDQASRLWHKLPCSCCAAESMFSYWRSFRSVFVDCLLAGHDTTGWTSELFWAGTETGKGHDHRSVWAKPPDARLDQPLWRFKHSVSTKGRLWEHSNIHPQRKTELGHIWTFISEHRRPNLDAFELLGQKSIPRLRLWPIKCAKSFPGSTKTTKSYMQALQLCLAERDQRKLLERFRAKHLVFESSHFVTRIFS